MTGARRDTSHETGAALVMVLLMMLLVSAVSAMLVVGASSESLLAANAGAQGETFHAASAAVERTVAELRSVPDLSQVLDGTIASRFVDGPPGPRRLPDGTLLDLRQLVDLAGCNRTRPCTGPELDALLPGRPWGPRNPRWRLYSYGPLEPDRTGAHSGLPLFVVSMVADDPAESDGSPLVDGGGPLAATNPGTGIVLVRGEAYGRRGSRRVVEVTAVRVDLREQAAWLAADPAIRGPAPSGPPRIRMRGWHEVR